MTEPHAPESHTTPLEQPGRSRTGVARRRRWALLRESVIIVGSALVLSFVVKTFLVQAFFIPSPSMNDTLVRGDRVMVSKLTPGPFDIERGDIVVFKDPGGWLADTGAAAPGRMQTVLNDALTFIGLRPADSGEHLIKRVIGLPGDRVAAEGDGTAVTVNGVPLDESYLAEGATPSEKKFDVVVPEGKLWVMGDNRQQSADSRWNMGKPGGGFLPEENVVGKAFVTVWPIDRWGLLTNPSATFESIPDPA